MKKSLFLLVGAFCLALAANATPKYIFMFIGDGMGMGHVMATETYNRLVLNNDENILMMQFPVASMAMTYSASSPVTDSAAAGTALATGNKTKNGMIGMTPDSVAVTSIATELKAQGYGVGLVTSVAYDDATPAAFYAHQINRGMYEEINADGAKCGFNFLGGAGTHVAEKSKEKAEQVFDNYRANGFTVAHGLDALSKANVGDKVLLTSHAPVTPNEIGYTVDSIAGALTLQQLTTACLDHLKKVSPDKFFMMVEGGNIDHAAHGNDGGAVVKEILNFNKCIRVAYDFYLQHPEETLIVITADHDTGGMTVGVNNGPKNITLKEMDCQKISKEQFNDFCSKNGDFTWEQMKEAMSDKLGFWTKIGINEEEEARMKESYDRMKAHDDRTQKTLYKEFWSFTAIVFDILNHKYGIGFTTTSHTGNPVPVFAIGEGCEEFKDLNNNIEIPQKIRELTDLD